MDARRSQVYNALFRVSSGTVTRLCEDRAISVADLLEELGSYDERIMLAGDGAQLVFDSSDNDNISLLPENIRYQRASSTAIAAFDKYIRGEALSPAALMPSYLRLSQAERERLEKKGC
jgi:tRNA threonylcarbamoyladenosine biosynthesis protein TsaB